MSCFACLVMLELLGTELSTLQRAESFSHGHLTPRWLRFKKESMLWGSASTKHLLENNIFKGNVVWSSWEDRIGWRIWALIQANKVSTSWIQKGARVNCQFSYWLPWQALLAHKRESELLEVQRSWQAYDVGVGTPRVLVLFCSFFCTQNELMLK